MLVTSDKMKNYGATKILNNFRNLIDDFQIILEMKINLVLRFTCCLKGKDEKKNFSSSSPR